MNFFERFDDPEPLDTPCQKCGSNENYWRKCWNCEEGCIEKDFGDDVVPEYHLVACDICKGAGGYIICKNCIEKNDNHFEKIDREGK